MSCELKEMWENWQLSIAAPRHSLAACKQQPISFAQMMEASYVLAVAGQWQWRLRASLSSAGKRKRTENCKVWAMNFISIHFITFILLPLLPPAPVSFIPFVAHLMWQINFILLNATASRRVDASWQVGELSLQKVWEIGWLSWVLEREGVGASSKSSKSCHLSCAD